MTHEERAIVIKRILLLVLATAVVTAVWFYPKPVKKVETKAEAAPPPDTALQIADYHIPGDPNCEKMAEILNKVQKKYDRLVHVTFIDVKAHPELAKAEGVTKAPHVIISADKNKVFEFEGVWNQEQVERKVEEILRGLKRVDKNWRPTVAGMKPAGS
ncbi:MAG: thioredoxin family protein [Luteolibacter sp.]